MISALCAWLWNWKSIWKDWFEMKNIYSYFLMAVSFVLITFFGVKYSQDFLQILPLYVSLIVMILQIRVNRYAFLLGGLNSVLYAVVYFFYKLYGSALYAITVSFVMQIATFVSWGKHSYKKTSTIFKSMGLKKFLVFSGAFALVWFVCYIIFRKLGSSHTLLDNSVMLLGIVTTVLTMLSYVEWTYMQNLGCIINVILYASMLKEEPQMATYLVSMVYSLLCANLTLVNVRKVYKEQKAENISR